MGKIASLVKEIQIKENLKSPRQVFERYPHLGELYYKEFQEEKDLAGAVDVSTAEGADSTQQDKKLLLD